MKKHRFDRDTQTARMGDLLPALAQVTPEPLPLFGGQLQTEEQALTVCRAARVEISEEEGKFRDPVRWG